ncbi:ferritin-like domain-containing protein [Halostreptopolyspora alba]|uniref:Ferritin-like domain-containing protein n=1 Tax=Halostreptopolyspora alba TaxID=2487137 RepID=A0A3N0E4G3_9ACTN|nr:ferritin-like domain-containing protein [Nocardiopsaceae bacterium YIM 96095]
MSAIAALTVTGASGCRGSRWYPSEVTPNEYVLRSVIAGKKRTITRYETALANEDGPTDLLERLLGRHRHHLETLRERLPEHGNDEPWAPENSPDASTSSGPDTAAETAPASVSVSGLRVAEESAAGERPRQLPKLTDPGLAQLIASIGACEAAHAHLLKEEG